MSLDLHLAPFLPQDAVFVDQKGAAFNTTHLFAVRLFGPEVFVCFQTVPRNTKDFCIRRLKFSIGIAKILTFRGTARRIVFGVKIKYDVLTLIAASKSATGWPVTGGVMVAPSLNV